MAAKIIPANILCTLVLSLSLNILVTFAQDLTVVVDVPELGKIQGYKAFTARDQRPYWVFHGIPYAHTASYTGCKRFQPSEVQTDPLTEDGSIFLANRLQIICPQNAIIELPEQSSQDLVAILGASAKSKQKIMKSTREAKSIQEAKSATPKHWGREDCLTVNINTPRIPTGENDKLLPVILFLHGGGSDSIWGSAFTGLRLMEEEVVLLTINYRLGALGAFNLQIDEAPGCGALYDVITALKWIERYVSHFGGDPNKVTITGQSAGAMMVTHLMLSPLAKGLFHGVWGFSGSALNVWATAAHPSINHHLDVAHYAGCHDRDDTTTPINHKAVAECMASKDVQDIIVASNLYEEQETSAGRLGYDGKGPASIQSPYLTHPKFMIEEPMEILKQRKQSPVPLVLGATRHDGSFPLDDIYNKYLLPSGQLENETYVQNEMLRELMKTFGVVDDAGGLYHSMAREYMGDAANTGDFDAKIPGLIDIATVFGYKGGQYKMIEYHAKVQPKSYFYSFDYKGRWTLYNVLWGVDKKIPGGICHTDDMMYLFYIFPLFNDDMRVSRRLIDYFVNFATYGDPNGPVEPTADYPPKVVWPEYDQENHSFLIMNRIDKIGQECPESWIDASLELVKSKRNDRAVSEIPVEAGISWGTDSDTLQGRTDWGVSSDSAKFNNLPCRSFTGSTEPAESTNEPTTPVEAGTTIPEEPTTNPENPTTNPENPTTNPENPTTNPENPTTKTEEPTTNPENPTTNLEETTNPENPGPSSSPTNTPPITETTQNPGSGVSSTIGGIYYTMICAIMAVMFSTNFSL